MLNKEFSKLCTPAKIYFAIAVVACIFALFHGMAILAVFAKLVFAFIWTFLLSWLCKKGYETISWALVLLPYVVMMLAVFGIMRLSMEQRRMLNMTKLQGAWGQEHFTSTGASKSTGGK